MILLELENIPKMPTRFLRDCRVPRSVAWLLVLEPVIPTAIEDGVSRGGPKLRGMTHISKIKSRAARSGWVGSVEALPAPISRRCGSAEAAGKPQCRGCTVRGSCMVSKRRCADRCLERRNLCRRVGGNARGVVKYPSKKSFAAWGVGTCSAHDRRMARPADTRGGQGYWKIA
jgi:hypothetical protein